MRGLEYAGKRETIRRMIQSIRNVLFLFSFVALLACGDDDGGRTIPNPLVTGPYAVGVTRVELFDETQGRTQLTEIWYPAAESARGEDPAGAASYLPPQLADLAANATVPAFSVRDAELSPDAPFPLIAFSHGSGGVRFQNIFQVEHLASHGYIVIAPDHEGNTFFDLSGGDLVTARPRDIIFLLDSFESFAGQAGHRFEGWVDTSLGYGVTGHSFGAFTSLAVADSDPRIVAAMPMAFGGPVSEGYSAATFLMLATEDQTIGLNGNQGVRDAFENAPQPRYIAEIVDAGHYSFTFSCHIGIPGVWDTDGCDEAERLQDMSPFTFVDDVRVWDVVNGYGAAFFGRYIKGIEEYDSTLATNLDREIVLYVADPADA